MANWLARKIFTASSSRFAPPEAAPRPFRRARCYLCLPCCRPTPASAPQRSVRRSTMVSPLNSPASALTARATSAPNRAATSMPASLGLGREHASTAGGHSRNPRARVRTITTSRGPRGTRRRPLVAYLETSRVARAPAANSRISSPRTSSRDITEARHRQDTMGSFRVCRAELELTLMFADDSRLPWRWPIAVFLGSLTEKVPADRAVTGITRN